METKSWIENAQKKGLFGITQNNKKDFADLIWSDSLVLKDDRTYALARIKPGDDLLFIMSDSSEDISYESEFSDYPDHTQKTKYYLCPLNHHNASLLRKEFPVTAPSPAGTNASSFGVGDRLGLLSTLHLELFKKTSLIPVISQQSIRECVLLNRSYDEPIDVATWAVFRTGYQGIWAADGDHIQEASDVKDAVERGCTMITADLSGHINYEFMDLNDEELIKEYGKLDNDFRDALSKEYLGRKIINDEISLDITVASLASAVLVFKDAVTHAKNLYDTASAVNHDIDFEVSIDETESMTPYVAHFYISNELMKLNIPITSVAPRFVGEFQKALDYIGDIDEFRENFRIHAAIAKNFGYKISVHSFSDKFLIYPIVGSEAKGFFHGKTAGTQWLEALRICGKVDPDYYRILHKQMYAFFDKAKTYYHVEPDLSKGEKIDTLDNEELMRVFDNPTDRQVLHITYGEVLSNKEHGNRLKDILKANIEMFWDRIYDHIGRHLELLDVVTEKLDRA